MPTAYDATRAAIAGGFGDDLAHGEEVARRLKDAFDRLLEADPTPSRLRIQTELIHAVADLWEGEPTQNPEWVTRMVGSVNAILRDMREQFWEARETAPFTGAGEATR